MSSVGAVLKLSKSVRAEASAAFLKVRLPPFRRMKAPKLVSPELRSVTPAVLEGLPVETATTAERAGALLADVAGLPAQTDCARVYPRMCVIVTKERRVCQWVCKLSPFA